jgi:hypothetical protein
MRTCIFISAFDMPNMKIEVVVRDAEEGGFWAEVPGYAGVRDAGRNRGRVPAQSA